MASSGGRLPPLPAARPARRGAVPADAEDRRCASPSSAASRSSSSPCSSCGSGRCRSCPATHYLKAATNNQLRTLRDRGAARPDPRPRRPGARHERPRHGRASSGRPTCRKAAAATRSCSGSRRSCTSRSPRSSAKIRAHAERPADAGDAQASVHRDQVAYLDEHARSSRGVHDRRDLPAPLQLAGARRPAARLRRARSRPAQLKTLRQASSGYQAGDDDRPVGRRGALRQRACAARRDARAARRLARAGRTSSRRRPADDARRAIRLTIDIQLQRAAERALQLRDRPRARSDGQWAARRRRDRRARPAQRRDPRAGLEPDVQAERLRRPRRPEEARAAARPEGRRSGELPGARTARSQGLYPPGSTFKPVTALAAMQEHLISPYQTLPCTGSYTVQGARARPGLQELGPLVEPADGRCRPRSPHSCDTYFYQLGYWLLRPAARARPPAPGLGEPLRVRRSRPGIDIGPEATRPAADARVAAATYTKKTDPCCWQIDRLWKPGDSIQLAIGQKDLLVTPLQMARFYALIANGGKLVTPHVVADVEEPGERQRRPRSSARFARRRRRTSASTRTRSRSSAQGLYEATHASLRHVVRRLRELPVPIAGKTGTAEKVVHVPGYRPAARGPVLVVRLRARRQADDRRLRADRERRPRRHGRGAGGAQGLRAVLRRERAAARRRSTPTDASTTPARQGRGAGAAGAERPTTLASLVRRLDWVLARRRRRRSSPTGSGRSAGITRDDVAGDPNHYLVRQVVFAAVGCVAFVARRLRRPGVLPPLPDASLYAGRSG